MAEKNALWTVLVLPIIVGALVALFTYGLPKFVERGKELSYTIEPPVALLTDTTLKRVSIRIDSVNVQSAYLYRAAIWNSGSEVIEGAVVQPRFEESTTPNDGFRILGVFHSTDPPYQFGAIDQVVDRDGATFRYALLNPGNRDVATFITTEGRQLKLYSNPPGVRVKPVAKSRDTRIDWRYLAIAMGLAGFFASAAKDALDFALRRVLSLRR